MSRDFAAAEPRGGEAEAARCRKLMLAAAFEQLHALARRLERGGRILPGDAAVENICALLESGGVDVTPRAVRDAAARLARAAAQREPASAWHARLVEARVGR